MVFPITATAIPCRGSARLGSVDQVLLARSYARAVLKTLRVSSPPKVISFPSTYAAPRSLLAVGSGVSLVHLPVAGSKRCTALVFLEGSRLRPPMAYRYLPSDTAAR